MLLIDIRLSMLITLIWLTLSIWAGTSLTSTTNPLTKPLLTLLLSSSTLCAVRSTLTRIGLPPSASQPSKQRERSGQSTKIYHFKKMQRRRRIAVSSQSLRGLHKSLMLLRMTRRMNLRNSLQHHHVRLLAPLYNGGVKKSRDWSTLVSTKWLLTSSLSHQCQTK
jgi:hypothetical protein